MIAIEYEKEFEALFQVLKQKKDDSIKIYSIHEPKVLCISNGKEHKKYEFGNKSSYIYTRKSAISLGTITDDGNKYDRNPLEPQLDQVKELIGGRIRKAIVNIRYKFKGGIRKVQIVKSNNLKKEGYYKEENVINYFG